MAGAKASRLRGIEPSHSLGGRRCPKDSAQDPAMSLRWEEALGLLQCHSVVHRSRFSGGFLRCYRLQVHVFSPPGPLGAALMPAVHRAGCKAFRGNTVPFIVHVKT